MPVSDALRSRREGKRGFRTFCGFARRPTARGVRPQADGETVLGYCDRAMEPETYAPRRCGVCGRLAIGRRRRPGRPYLPGHGDHADRGAVLRRSQPALAHIGESRAVRLRSGRLREITDERTISDLVAGACCSRRCSMAPGRQARPFGRYGLAGSAGRWPLPAVPRRTQPGRRRPTALLCTHFARRIHRRAVQLAAVAGTRPACPSRPRTAVQRPLHAGQVGSRLPLAAEVERLQISRDNRYRETPGGTSAAAFLPDAPGRIGVPSP